MGDPNKKELSEEEMDSFDEKRSEAMQAYSEVGLGLFFIIINFFSTRVSGRNPSDCSLRPSRSTPTPP